MSIFNSPVKRRKQDLEKLLWGGFKECLTTLGHKVIGVEFYLDSIYACITFSKENNLNYCQKKALLKLYQKYVSLRADGFSIVKDRDEDDKIFIRFSCEVKDE